MQTNLYQCEQNSVFSAELWGKWRYSARIEQGTDGYPVVRYLQADGSWGRFCHWFGTKEDVDLAISVGSQPDFVLSIQERVERLDERLCLMDDEELESWYDDAN